MGSLPAVKMVKAKHTAPAHCAKKKPSAAPKKAPKYYPAEDVKGKLGNFHNTSKQTKLRKSIQAGTVVIMLAGHFKGCRAVVLKQLDSGLLLVTGPYKLNGVPLRRVPQSYVIGTSTVVDVSGVNVPKEVNDDFFKKPKAAKKKDGELFFEEKNEKTIDEARKKTQEAVEAKLVAAVSKDALLKAYLSSKFSLKNGDKPHLMSF